MAHIETIQGHVLLNKNRDARAKLETCLDDPSPTYRWRTVEKTCGKWENKVIHDHHCEEYQSKCSDDNGMRICVT